MRTAPNLVILSVCRPDDEQFRTKLSPAADPPRPPQRSLHTTTTFEPQSPIQTAFTGVSVYFNCYRHNVLTFNILHYILYIRIMNI